MKWLALFALVGCTSEETGINDLHVRGSVLVPPLGVPSRTEPQDVKVGAFLPVEGAAPNPFDRGNPVGGAGVSAWTLRDDGVWVGEYEMIFLRSVGPVLDTADPGVLLDLDLDVELAEVWLIAMTAPTLDSAFTSGTRYTSEPVGLHLGEATGVASDEAAPLAPSFRTIDAPTITIDGFIEPRVGWLHAEAEPNDVEIVGSVRPRIEPDGFVACEDVGALSGLGITDTLEGGMVMSDSERVNDHDIDCFHFTVPEAGFTKFTLWYDNSVCDWMFVVAWNSDGAYYDFAQGEELETPVRNGYPLNHELVPGEDYYLTVLAASGLAGEEAQYLLDIEQFDG